MSEQKNIIQGVSIWLSGPIKDEKISDTKFHRDFIYEDVTFHCILTFDENTKFRFDIDVPDEESGDSKKCILYGINTFLDQLEDKLFEEYENLIKDTSSSDEPIRA